MGRGIIMGFFTIVGIIAVVVFIFFLISWLIDDQGGFTGWECILMFATVYWKWTVSILVIGAFLLGFFLNK
jgi:hypothetical protein